MPIKAEMLRERKIRCCLAVGKPAIRAECSKGQGPISQTADEADFYGEHLKGRLVEAGKVAH